MSTLLSLTIDSSNDDALPVSVQYSRFMGDNGTEEIHFIIRPTQYADFATQLRWVESAYDQTLQSLGLPPDSAVWRRFLCSDLINQELLLLDSEFSNPTNQHLPCAISWINQAPAHPAKVGIWAHHIHDPESPLKKSLDALCDNTSSDNTPFHSPTLSLKRGPLTHHWTTGITAPPSQDAKPKDSHTQTHDIFDHYLSFLDKNEITLADHVVRTWFFVQNVDTNYAGMVEARNEVFQRHGLTADTHYIASTGIEGSFTSPETTVTLDSYSITGLIPDQVSYLNAEDHLSPTHLYGVAFERGTAIAYRDRTHLFISGTASIDDKGNTLHLGNIVKQFNRTLLNIDALLREKKATLDDMQVILIYLRDPTDQLLVKEVISQRLPNLPFIIVTAAVCRPGWLIEIEGLATIKNNNPTLPNY